MDNLSNSAAGQAQRSVGHSELPEDKFTRRPINLDVPAPDGEQRFGALLVEHRLAANLTQARLAEQAGMSKRGVQQLERGLCQPQRDTVVRLARALGLTPEAHAAFKCAAMPTPRRRLWALPNRSAPHATPTNSPNAYQISLQLTTFVGRQRECAEVARLLAHRRLVTLVGVGGVGKTRLALEVAQMLGDEYPDGTALVELAALANPAHVASAMAACLGFGDIPGQDLDQTLITFLRTKRLLLVLDNCEHLVAACADLVSTLLRSCPQLSVLATSRQLLAVAGETAWPVPPLSLPDVERGGSADDIADSDAVRLFCDRASSVSPEFVLTDGNAPWLARICNRLDGLPLAIELAAARVRLLGPEQLFERLDDRFRLLVGGSRTLPSRQQTLRATLDWSLSLLSDSERDLLRWLSVFNGGWTLEAAEAVCAGNGLATRGVLDVLGELVDRSLVVVEGQELAARYRLLETVREYALELLRESGEEELLLERHATWYLAFAERGEPELSRAEQELWLARIEREHDNLRAALNWTRGKHAEAGLRLAASLGRFWEKRGFLMEGRAWLEGLLAAVPDRTSVRARALHALGEITRFTDLGASRSALEESLGIHTELGNTPGRALALRMLGQNLAIQGDFGGGRKLMEESAQLFRSLGDPAGEGWALGTLGMFMRSQHGHEESARQLLEDALALARPGGDPEGLAFILNNLGQLARQRGDCGTARRLLEESLRMFRTIGARTRVAWTLVTLGNVARLAGDTVGAHAFISEGLALAQTMGNRKFLSTGLGFSALLAAQVGQEDRAVRLLAAAMQYSDARSTLDSDELRDWDASLARARARLGEQRFDRTFAEGQALTLDQAVACALVPNDGLPKKNSPIDSLSVREQAVAILIARGHSNREIAETLVITPRTVENHVAHVLNKLGLRSRTEVAVWAVEHGLTKRDCVHDG